MIIDLGFRILDFLRRHWLAALLSTVLGIAGLGVYMGVQRAREIRMAAERGTLQAEISNLKGRAAEAEKRADVAEGRGRELLGQVERLRVESQKLAVELEKLKSKEAAERARIAALTPAEVATEVTEKIGPSDDRTIGPSEDQARKVLEIIADRDACLQGSTVNSQLLANCRESLVDYAAIGEQQAIQIRDLKQALDLERRGFDKRDDLAKLQVKTAQGTWIHRVWNRVKFPVGIALGAVGGYAVGRATR